MKKEHKRTGRRQFLAGSIKTLVATPLAVVSTRTASEEGGKLLEEGAEPLPGEPGYRDPDTYGSLAD